MRSATFGCEDGEVDPYYGADAARVHDLGFGHHAEVCGPGILDLLRPLLDSGGLVLELGCGSGALTTRLVAAGHRLIATDASPAMLDLARSHLPAGSDVRTVSLPDDPLPPADAIVAIGHPLNYLPDAAAVDRALVAIAGALRPGGLLAVDLCDLTWGRERADVETLGWCGPDWALVTRFSLPSPDRYVRELTTFLPAEGGLWRRSVETHENVLVDTGRVPALLDDHGLDAEVRTSFGGADLPFGLHAIIGCKRLVSDADGQLD